MSRSGSVAVRLRRHQFGQGLLDAASRRSMSDFLRPDCIGGGLVYLKVAAWDRDIWERQDFDDRFDEEFVVVVHPNRAALSRVQHYLGQVYRYWRHLRTDPLWSGHL